jgi:hypothetical protein
VVNEARRALKQNKIVCAHVPGFDLAKLPPDMSHLHSTNINYVSDIRTALWDRGLTGRPAEPQSQARSPFAPFFPDLVRIRTRLASGDARLADLDKLIETITKREPSGLDCIGAGVAIALLIKDLRELPSEDRLALEALSTHVHAMMAQNPA